MLTLILLRHAKAEPAGPGVDDADRPLAARGRSDAPRIGAAISQAGFVPDLILCSPARRTRETLELVVPSFGAVIATRLEPAIYEATTARLLAVVRRTPASVQRLMLVGHNPGFEELTQDLIRTADKDAAARLDKKFPTSGLAVLTFEHDFWAKVTPRSAHMALFTAPRYLD